MNTRTLPEFFPDEESRRRFLAVSVVMDRLMREETHEESDSDRAFGDLAKRVNEEVELIMNPKPSGMDVEIREEDTICPICNEVYFDPHRLVMCEHIFCLPCLLERFDKGDPSLTYLEECPLCRKTIFFVPRRELHLNTFTAKLRAKQGMPSPPTDSPSSNPFEKYTI